MNKIDDSNALAHELGIEPEQGSSVQDSKEDSRITKRRNQADQSIKLQNIKDTFGHGIGKAALIMVGVVVVTFSLLAVSSMKGKAIAASDSKVDAPITPQNKITVTPVTQIEADRHKNQSIKEANEALRKNKSYQPGFDVNIKNNNATVPAQSASFANFAIPSQQTDNSAQIASTKSSGTDANSENLAITAKPVDPVTQTGGMSPQQLKEQVQRTDQNNINDYKSAINERDKYENQLRDSVLNQVGGMFSVNGEGSLNALGTYTVAAYPVPATTSPASRSAPEQDIDRAHNPIIKAGTSMYAMLDSEANTDDGKMVMATITSGPWKGSKLIGQILQENDNIALNFTILASPDNRPTLRINAVALREQDGKIGMAETRNYHTFSRYTALAAATLLQGAGRVYQTPVGTTVSTNSGIVTTTNEPTDRQVIGSAVGQMGTTLGSEIQRRGFNRPNTYATPAFTGFILFFLQDVMPPSSSILGQQQLTRVNTGGNNYQDGQNGDMDISNSNKLGYGVNTLSNDSYDAPQTNTKNNGSFFIPPAVLKNTDLNSTKNRILDNNMQNDNIISSD